MQTRDVTTSIRELIELLPVELGPTVEAACKQNLRMYPQPERSTFKINAMAHSYGPNNTKICDGRFGAVVFEEMCKDGRCSAPTHSKAAIYTGKVETLFPFDDLVVKFVDPQERSIFNVTLPKHIFFPGYVKLVVIEGPTDTAVAVSGKGKGNWMWPNTRFGPLLFATILKEHLVPKVNRRTQGMNSFTGGGGSFGGAGARGRW